MHPFLPQEELLQYCSSRGIHVTAYSPLGNAGRPDYFKWTNFKVIIDDPAVCAIASKHSCSPAQVLLRWALSCGVSTIPKSVNRDRLLANLQSVSVSLDSADMAALVSLGCGLRLTQARAMIGGMSQQLRATIHVVCNIMMLVSFKQNMPRHDDDVSGTNSNTRFVFHCCPAHLSHTSRHASFDCKA